MKKQNGSVKIGLLGFMFLIFLTLKLMGQIAWSWWWVTAPLWVGAALWILAVAFLVWVSS